MDAKSGHQSICGRSVHCIGNVRLLPLLGSFHVKPSTVHMSPFRRPPVQCGCASRVTAKEDLIPELMEFLKHDLEHLFDDQGIDRAKYEANVVFEDPITRHTSIQGYLLNIAFLRRVFDPSFSLLDIRQTGPYEITTRWSMKMQPTFIKFPALQRVWNPVLTFTGTSVMVVNPATGRFNRHEDTWDALSDSGQKFFSLEAFIHMLSQVFDLKRTPWGLSTPQYEVLVKRARYEVRRYAPFCVAQSPLVFEGQAEKRAFGSLAGYIFGKNVGQQKMAMTTPVYSSEESMSFYLGPAAEPTTAPAPLDPEIRVTEMPGGVFAVATFSGVGDEVTSAAVAEQLRLDVASDGLRFDSHSPWTLARYNDPGTPPPFRRNEVLLPLQDFKLW